MQKARDDSSMAVEESQKQEGGHKRGTEKCVHFASLMTSVI